MYRAGYQLALERGLIDPDEPTAPEPEKMPEEPGPVVLPEEPELKLPAEPISWYDLIQKSYNAQEADNAWWPMLDEWANRYGVNRMDYVNDFETRQSQYTQAHAAWEAECEPIKAEHDKEVEKRQAECDRLNAEHDMAIADWKAECEATEKRNEQAVADFEAAHKEWLDNYGDLSKTMVKLCRDEDAAGNSDFRDYNDLMSDIRQNFILVAVECAKPEGIEPLLRLRLLLGPVLQLAHRGVLPAPSLSQQRRAPAQARLRPPGHPLRPCQGNREGSGGTHHHPAPERPQRHRCPTRRHRPRNHRRHRLL